MEVSFERVDQEEFNTSQNTAAKGGAAAIAANGQISVPQRCTVKMLGNNLFDLGKDFYIDIRPGENRRCQNYCDVSQFCNQWARINPNKEDSV